MSLRTLPSRAVRLLSSAIFGASLAACASAPSEVTGAKDIAITYWDLRTNQAMALVSANNPKYQDLYSKQRAEGNMKVATDEQLRSIVDRAASADFFDYAEPIRNPDESTAETKYRMLVILADDRPYSLLLYKGLADQKGVGAVNAFNATNDAFLSVFNSITAMQYVTSTSSGSNFAADQQKSLEEQRRAAAEKMKAAKEQLEKDRGGKP